MKTSAPVASLWQEPFVDVFKLAGVAEKKHAHWRGRVAAQLDKSLGQRVLRIGGNITANNYIEIPGPSASAAFKSNFALTGRFLYLQARAVYGKPYNVHLDFRVQGHHNTLRVSLSKIYPEFSASPGEVIHVPCHISDERWTVVEFDVLEHLQRSGLYTASTLATPAAWALRRVKLCANLDVKTLFTSNTHFGPDTLPPALAFKRLRPGLDFFDTSAWLDLSAAPFPVLSRPDATPHLLPDPTTGAPCPGPIEEEDIEEMMPAPLPGDPGEARDSFDANLLFDQEVKGATGTAHGHGHGRAQAEKEKEQRAIEEEQQAACGPPPPPEQLMALSSITGYSLQNCGDLRWVPGTKSLFFPAGNTLVAMDAGGERAQQYFFGHSGPIVCVAVSGSVVATAEQGRPPLIIVRDWRQGRVLVSLTAASLISIQGLSLSGDGKSLVVVGKERHNREEIVVWPVSPEAKYSARQLSDFNVLSLKFLPADPSRLASCGKENIRFWRVKNGHLPGAAVVLNQHARNTVFTCLDFSGADRLFAGSKDGMVFQVSCSTQKLQAVYQVHSAPIYSLAANEAFCVTGSEDHFLRVWPLDFSEFFMEAKHEGTVSAVDISSDGIQIACGTLSGSLGVLDLASQRYKTLLRSHVGDIIALALHAPSQNLITVATDKTIRLWEYSSFTQSYEFSSAEDLALCVAAHPTLPLFACGFLSGAIRVFDITATAVVEEYRALPAAVEKLAYTPDARLLIAVASDGALSVHMGGSQDDPATSTQAPRHQPLKLVQPECKEALPHVALSASATHFAVVGGVPGGSAVDLYDCRSLAKAASVHLPTGVTVRALKLTSACLAVASSDNKLKLFTAAGSLFKEIVIPVPAGSEALVNDIDLSPNGKYLVAACEDQLLRVWELATGYSQSFLGHGAPVLEAAFFSSNRLVSIGGSGGILCWNFAAKTEPTLDDFDLVLEPESLPAATEQIAAGAYESAGQGTTIVRSVSPNLLQDSPRNLAAKGSISQASAVMPNLPSHSSRFDSESDIKASYAAAALLERHEDDSLKLSGTNAKAPVRHWLHSMPRFQHHALTYCAPEHKPSTALSMPLSTDPELPGLHRDIRTYIGYNGAPQSNVIWNEKGGWTLYTLNNKVVLESLKDRSQVVLIETGAELSCIACDSQFQYLAAGTGYPINEEPTAPILLWKLAENPFASPPTLLRDLNFHHQGVQQMAFSADSKHLVSISVNQESSFAIWDVERGIVLHSQLLASPCIALRIRDRTPHLHKSAQLEFLTSHSDGAINSWQMTQHDLHNSTFQSAPPTSSQQENEQPNVPHVFISAEFLYHAPTHSYTVLLGTAAGALVLFDEQKKLFMQEASPTLPPEIRDSAITVLSASAEYLFIGNARGLLWRAWLEFSLQEGWAACLSARPRLGSVQRFDGPINAISYDEHAKEGQVATAVGSVWYSSFEGAAEHQLHQPVKLISSHVLGATTAAVFVDHSLFMTASEDETIRLWSAKSSDQVLSFAVPGAVCTQLVAHHSGKLVIAAFDDGSLRFFNVQTLSFETGRLKIGSAKLTGVGFLSDRKLLVADAEGAMFLVFVEQYTPLAARVQKIAQVGCAGISCLKVSPFADSHIFLAGSVKGKIRLWKMKQTAAGQSASGKDDATFVLYDGFDPLADPHGLSPPSPDLESSELAGGLTELYSMAKSQHAWAAFSTTSNNIYFSIVEGLQYIFVRDFTNHKLLKRVSLMHFPRSVDASAAFLAVGTKEGRVLVWHQDGKYDAPIAGLRERAGKPTHFAEVGCLTLYQPRPGGKNDRLISGSVKELANWDLKA